MNDIAAGSGLSGIVGGAPVDAVQEFKGNVAGLDSNMGTGSGGQFQLVTKSGSNQFHGDVNEYHRDTSTVSNSWFNNNSGVARAALIRNQFGGAVGGPILKDKLYFFFDFNNSRIIQSGSGTATVPLASLRAGNVSYINNRAGCAASSRQNTTPDCISTLSPAQVAALDPQHIGDSATITQLYSQRYPVANDLTGGNGVNTGLLRFNYPTPDIAYNWVGRLDYNLTSRQHVFARIVVAHEDSTESLPVFPSDPPTSPYQDRSYGWVISDIWQLGNNKVNQFYYGDNVSVYNFGNTYDPTGPTEYSLSGLTGPYPGPGVQRRRVPIPEVRDDFNWQVGNHSISFGGTFKFIKTNSKLVNDFNFVGIGTGGNIQNFDSSVRPTDIRTGTTSSNDYDAAFGDTLGRIGSVSRNYNYTNTGDTLEAGTGTIRRYRFFQTELYVGDNWKVTPHLTVSYGLRYQLYSVPYETAGAESVQNTSFDTYFATRVQAAAAGQTGNNVVPFISYKLGGKANHGPNLYSPSYKDFAPRVAFSYSPANAPHTVFNAGAGIVYDRTVINAVNFIQDQSSYLFQNSTSNNYGSSDGTATLLNDPRIGGSLAGMTYPAAPAAPAITKPYTPYVSGGVPYGLINSQFNEIVDPTLKDPYSIAFNAGMQQEIKGGILLSVNYAGRLGRRLLASADASQLIDFPDQASGQAMSTAFANIEQQVRSGATITPQPWFENQIGKGATVGLLAKYFSSLLQRGDMADTIQELAADGYLQPNVGMDAQFAENTYLTNKGFSSYNGLLLTAQKSMSNGLEFQFNYTWSHSMDNTSANANFIASSAGNGFICDATRPRECRSDSNFDVRQQISGEFVAKLPVGHGRTYLPNASRWLDEAVGGWELSGIPTWRSGIPFSPTSNAYVAGYANSAPAILVDSSATHLQQHVHKDSSGAVYLYSDSDTAANSFVGPIGLQIGRRNLLRGPSAFGLDLGLGKDFPIVYDRAVLRFRADAFNVFNHPTFSNPNADITSGTFGQISSTGSTARVAQFSLRLEF